MLTDFLFDAIISIISSRTFLGILLDNPYWGPWSPLRSANRRAAGWKSISADCHYSVTELNPNYTYFPTTDTTDTQARLMKII